MIFRRNIWIYSLKEISIFLVLEVVKGGKTFFWSGRYRNDLNSRDTLDTQLNVLADFQPKVPENYKMLM
jgi:hypothetical protein